MQRLIMVYGSIAGAILLGNLAMRAGGRARRHFAQPRSQGSFGPEGGY